MYFFRIQNTESGEYSIYPLINRNKAEVSLPISQCKLLEQCVLNKDKGGGEENFV